MFEYLKASVWDLVLTAAASMALCYMALDGFYVSPALQQGPLPALLCVVCCAALFAVARNGKTARLGGLAYAACIVVAWVAAGALTPGGDIFTDNESNYLIFAMICTAVPTLCFLVSRRRAGAALLFTGGVFLCALVQLLYERNQVVWLAVFVVAAIALVAFKNYQLSLRAATTVRTAAMMPGFAAALAVALLAVGVGAGVWCAIIAPLDPGAVEIKLVTEYRALETRQVIGTSNIFQTPNLDVTSSQINDAVRTTDDIQEDPEGMVWPATGNEEEEDDQDQESTFLGLDLDSLQNSFDLQQNPLVMPLMIGVILLLAALVAAYFLGRRRWRAVRLERLRQQGPAREFQGLFLFVLSRLGRLGIAIPVGQTMSEFGRNSQAALEPYDKGAQGRFSALAEQYCAVVYGNAEPSQELLEAMERYYCSFWKTCREQMGNARYLLKSFRL